jgi:hypothetical protein
LISKTALVLNSFYFRFLVDFRFGVFFEDLATFLDDFFPLVPFTSFFVPDFGGVFLADFLFAVLVPFLADFFPGATFRAPPAFAVPDFFRLSTISCASAVIPATRSA